MSALPDAAEVRMLAWLTDQLTVGDEPQGPFTLALLTVLGSDTAAGTEVVGGSYARPTMPYGAPGTVAGGSTVSNNVLIRIDDMPECDSAGAVQGDVIGYAIYDSGGFRWVHGSFTTARKFAAGDPAEINAGTLVVAAS